MCLYCLQYHQGVGHEGCTGRTHTGTKPVPTNTSGECVRVSAHLCVCVKRTVTIRQIHTVIRNM